MENVIERTRGVLSQYGLVVPVAVLRVRLGAKYQQFLSKLVATHAQLVGPPKRMLMYKLIVHEGRQYLVLPRTLLRVLSGPPVVCCIDIRLAPLQRIMAPLQIDLFDNQRLIIGHLVERVFTAHRLAAGSATCILNLRAGMGKTFVAAGLLSRLGLRTLFVVPKIPLAAQAVKDLKDCLYSEQSVDNDLDQVTVGRYCAKEAASKESRTQSVSVVVINTAVKMPPEVLAGYSLIILDEVHSYCTEGRKEIFKAACAPAILGMSATTEDRRDGFDVVAHKELAFDGIIRAEEIPGFTYEDVQFDCHAKIIRYSGPSSHTANLRHESTGYVFTHYMHNQFISDPYRTQLAVNELIELYDWKMASCTELRDDENHGDVHHRATQYLTHFIIVFAEEIDILVKAKDAMIAALIMRQRNDIVGNIEAPELGLRMFTGGLTPQQITEATTNGRVLFATYSYAGTGVSITDASALLFLTPRRANMKQILPRILRRGSNTAIPRIAVDIVDNKTSMRYQVGDRKMAYDFYGFKQVEHKVSYGALYRPT